jgi:uncharacterized protein YyaL (SSP411 family)
LVKCAALVATGLLLGSIPEPAAATSTVPEALPGAAPLSAELRTALSDALEELGPDHQPRTRQRRADGTPLYTNRLLLESSPYLRQHAHNPVNWFPWGEEAFAEARRTGRPVLVSIGYSTCHWCHVMEEESFDDPAIARLLNEHFVAIKVDREVRPDVDAIYMSASQLLTGGGGWPLNVFLTSDGEPFFAGTYFPPQDMRGRPSFSRVLESIREQMAEDPERLQGIANRVASAIRSSLETAPVLSSWAPEPSLLQHAFDQTAAASDPEWGGRRGAPKFPSSTPLRFLLRYHRRSGDPQALAIVERTLECMAAGGIHDQVGGGFHRYATDTRWLVPHFEKMLYDNAQLALLYLEAWQATGREDFAGVVRDILDYLEREMSAAGGGFYSATDADSPGPGDESHEGLFFTWTPEELADVLDPSELRVATAAFGVKPGGNYEGRSILHQARPPAQLAAELGISEGELAQTMDRVGQRLYRARQQRRAPARDEKIIAGWNGLAISAFARAAFAFESAETAERARRAAGFVLDELRIDGRLARIHLGGRSSGAAYLEDYAFVTAALLDLYEMDGDPQWLVEAKALQAVLDAHYRDPSGGYYRSADDQERLLAREKPSIDGAIPSGNSVEALNLLRLYRLTFDASYLEAAGGIFSAFRTELERSPQAFGELLLALDYQLDQAREVVIVRPEGGADTAAMLDPLRRGFLPNRVLSVVTEGPELSGQTELLPGLRNREARDGRVTAYVCVDRVCKLPTTDPQVLRSQLAAGPVRLGP